VSISDVLEALNDRERLREMSGPKSEPTSRRLVEGASVKVVGSPGTARPLSHGSQRYAGYRSV
jgi:hypothetical protein